MWKPKVTPNTTHTHSHKYNNPKIKHQLDITIVAREAQIQLALLQPPQHHHKNGWGYRLFGCSGYLCAISVLSPILPRCRCTTEPPPQTEHKEIHAQRGVLRAACDAATEDSVLRQHPRGDDARGKRHCPSLHNPVHGILLVQHHPLPTPLQCQGIPNPESPPSNPCTAHPICAHAPPH